MLSRSATHSSSAGFLYNLIKAENKKGVSAANSYFVVLFWFPPGGYLAHSLAIMTDAAHLLTDFGSMMVSLFSLWISSRPPTKTMNFGWHRSGQDDRSDTSEWMDGVRKEEKKMNGC